MAGLCCFVICGGFGVVVDLLLQNCNEANFNFANSAQIIQFIHGNCSEYLVVNGIVLSATHLQSQVPIKPTDTLPLVKLLYVVQNEPQLNHLNNILGEPLKFTAEILQLYSCIITALQRVTHA